MGYLRNRSNTGAGSGNKYPIITMDQAEAAALKARPGKVIFSALKGDHAHRIYVFAILNRRIVYQTQETDILFASRRKQISDGKVDKAGDKQSGRR
jgi:hypothetical protein